MVRAQSGDHAAFQELAAAVASRLYGTASLIMRDADSASDVVQETLIEVWRNLPSLRDSEAFPGWCRRILVRRCYRAIGDDRRRRVEVRGLETDAPSASYETRIGDVDQLERAFRRLSAEQRAVLVLHHREGLPLTETADSLGIPVGTVKSRLSRATVALRAALDAEDREVSMLGSQTA